MADGKPNLPSVQAEGERGVSAGATVAALLSGWTHGVPPIIGQRVLAYDRHASMPALIVSVEGPLIHLVVESPGNDRPTPAPLPEDQALADAFLQAFDEAVAKADRSAASGPTDGHTASD